MLMAAMSATQLQHTPLFLTISQVIQSLDSDLTTFRNCIETIGTAHDNSENRRELKRLRSVIKRKIADSESKLKEDSGKYVTHSLPWLHIPPSLSFTTTPSSSPHHRHTLLTPSPPHPPPHPITTTPTAFELQNHFSILWFGT